MPMHIRIFALLTTLLLAGAAAAEDTALCRQGLKAKQGGDFALAVKLYSLCIEKGKLGSESLGLAHYHRGESQRRLGRLRSAYKDFSAAIGAKFDLADAFTGRAMTLAQGRKHGLAIVDYQRALRFQPDNANLYYNRALSYIANRQYDEALRDLDKVLAVNPRFFGAVHYNRGVVFARLRLYDKAAQEFDYSIQRRWRLAIAYLERGFLFLRGRKYAAAVQALDATLTIKPNFGDAYAYRGLAHEGRGDIAAAGHDYELAEDYGTALDWVAPRRGNPGCLHAPGATADDHKIGEGILFSSISGDSCLLQVHQHLVTNIYRITDILEPYAMLLQFGHSKEIIGSTRCQNQVIITQASLIGHDCIC